MMKKIIMLLSLLIIGATLIGIVTASDTIEATTSDTFYFYSLNGPASESGYDAAIIINGTPYYLGYNEYDKLCEESPAFAKGFMTQYQDTSQKADIRNNLGVKYGEISTKNTGNGDFELSVDKPIKFTYHTGKVGMNKEAHIIDSLTF